MKKILSFVILFFHCMLTYAMGPNELNINGIKFHKRSENAQKNKFIAEYSPNDQNSSLSIIITHILDKKDPNKLVHSLKEKKSVEIVDVENIKSDRSDLLVSFIQFDLPNLKVKNNLCRIKSYLHGSIVFQYIDKKKLKSQSEGVVLPDLAQLSDELKQLPLDKYLTTLSERKSTKWDHLPWYKRPNARSGYYHYSGDRYKRIRPRNGYYY